MENIAEGLLRYEINNSDTDSCTGAVTKSDLGVSYELEVLKTRSAQVQLDDMAHTCTYLRSALETEV